MKKIGSVKPRTSNDIRASKIGVGFECLDRQMWDDTDEHYRLAGRLGVKHARLQTGWSRCEKVVGEYEFAWLDRSIDKLRAEGVQPWLSVSYGNIHHTDATEPDAVGYPPIFSEASREAWRKYVAALVDHVKDRVTHYEIWNEPDIDPFWQTGNNPSEYMDLVKLTVPVIREHQADAKIIGGAMAGGLNIRGFSVLEEYLKQGFASLIDVYSYHRYKVVPELDRPRDLARLRATFDAHDGAHVELWQAEGGFPSKTSTTQALANVPLDEDTQAQLLARALINELAMGVDYTCYFHFSDFKFYYRHGFTDVPNFFGLVTFDEPPRVKQSFHVLSRICSLFDDETRRASRSMVTVGPTPERQKEDRYAFHDQSMSAITAAFERRGAPLAAWWTPASHLGERGVYPHPVDVKVYAPDAKLTSPVVIDVVTGEVFEPETQADTYQGATTLRGVPMKGYPLVATEHAAVDDLIDAT